MNKFNSRKIEADGMKFDSRKEYMRWNELCLLQKAGKIRNLQCQVKYILIPAQTEIIEVYSPKTGNRLKDKEITLEKECSYVADFVYERPVTMEKRYYSNGEHGTMEVVCGMETVVEDVKGYKKGAAYALFVVKRKLMLQEYGIKVREI